MRFDQPDKKVQAKVEVRVDFKQLNQITTQ